MSISTNRPAGPHPSFLLLIRLVVAVIWLYEGLWQKVIVRDAHELSIVQSFAATPEAAHQLMLLIGGGETLLGLGVLSGLFPRFIACFQIALLLTMNGIGILFGGGKIANPVGLIIHNLPLLACMACMGLYGPGPFSLRLSVRRRQTPPTPPSATVSP
jgi:uncharacterized membrane protein YphA (DoxX/SURF4 family)